MADSIVIAHPSLTTATTFVDIYGIFILMFLSFERSSAKSCGSSRTPTWRWWASRAQGISSCYTLAIQQANGKILCAENECCDVLKDPCSQLSVPQPSLELHGRVSSCRQLLCITVTLLSLVASQHALMSVLHVAQDTHPFSLEEARICEGYDAQHATGRGCWRSRRGRYQRRS